MARSYKAVVGGDIQKTFGWSIPGSPYALASNDEGVEATYDLTQYATLPAGITPVWRVVASPAGVTIDQSGLLTKADSVPPYALYTVIIALSQDFDGYAETQRAFTFTVVPTNSAPIWAGAPVTLAMTSGVPYNFGQYASDPDGDALTFSLIGAPSNYSIDPATGAVTVAATNLIKWNPGNYVYLSPSDGHRDGAAQRQSDLAWFQNYANNPNIKGYYIQKYLYHFEGAQGVYDKTSTVNGVDYGGYAMIDWYLQQCRTYGNKRLLIEFEATGFGTVSNVLPPYWVTAGWFEQPTGYSGAKIWIEACMTRFLAMFQAYANRYNSHPLVEVIGIEETSYPVPSASISAWTTQMTRWLQTVPTYWTNTLTRYNANFAPTLSPDPILLGVVEQMNAARVGAIITGGPDPQGNYPSLSNNVCVLFRGETTLGGTTYPRNLRGTHAWFNSTEENFLTTNTIRTPAWIYDYAINVMQSSHLSWLSYVRWSEVLAEINARSGATVSTPPSTLAGRTATGVT